jgi:hypothetical protein
VIQTQQQNYLFNLAVLISGLAILLLASGFIVLFVPAEQLAPFLPEQLNAILTEHAGGGFKLIMCGIVFGFIAKGMKFLFKPFIAPALKKPPEQPSWSERQQTDPVAKMTSWKPANPGGIDFKIQTLDKLDDSRLTVRLTKQGKAYYAGGLALISIFIVAGNSYLANDLAETEKLFLMIIPLIALIGLLGHLYGNMKTTMFDRRLGWFWRGFNKISDLSQIRQMKTAIPLSDIHALQILAERVHENKKNYTSYELNLVLKDSTRVNVIDHGNKKVLLADAQTLADYLQVEVWHEA